MKTVDDGYREVRFDTYCPKCKYKNFPEEGEPCAECLGEVTNVHSYKPVNYIENDGSFAKYEKTYSEEEQKYATAASHIFDVD